MTADGPEAVAREMVVATLAGIVKEEEMPRKVERLLTLATHSNPAVRSILAETLGTIGAEAVGEKTISRLFALTADSERTVRTSAVQALLKLGGAVMKKEGIERLLALLFDEDAEVRCSAAWLLGQTEVAMKLDISARLAEFWQGQLADTESYRFGNFIGRACDVAYRELRRLAALQERTAQP